MKQVSAVATRLHLPNVELTEEQFTQQQMEQSGNKLWAAYERQADQQLTALLPELEKAGWAKELGVKGHLTLAQIKAAFPQGFDCASLDANLDGKITGKEVTDVLNQSALVRIRAEEKEKKTR